MTTGTPPRGGNRRLTARRACLLTVRYKTGKAWHPATAVNISQHGCRLRLGEDLERGTTVGVLFEAPLRNGATTLNAEVEGVVSWSRLEGLSHQVGIQFVSPPQALQDLMNSLA